eukprot:1527057-Rhodomonas_salina.2
MARARRQPREKVDKSSHGEGAKRGGDILITGLRFPVAWRRWSLSFRRCSRYQTARRGFCWGAGREDLRRTTHQITSKSATGKPGDNAGTDQRNLVLLSRVEIKTVGLRWSVCFSCNAHISAPRPVEPFTTAVAAVAGVWAGLEVPRGATDHDQSSLFAVRGSRFTVVLASGLWVAGRWDRMKSRGNTGWRTPDRSSMFCFTRAAPGTFKADRGIAGEELRGSEELRERTSGRSGRDGRGVKDRKGGKGRRGSRRSRRGIEGVQNHRRSRRGGERHVGFSAVYGRSWMSGSGWKGRGAKGHAVGPPVSPLTPLSTDAASGALLPSACVQSSVSVRVAR